MENQRSQSTKGSAIQATEEVADEEKRNIEKYDSRLEVRTF
jgi:hypothetical protein